MALSSSTAATAATTTDTDHARHLSARLNEQRKSGGAFCDVLLKVCGQTLPGHACVLSACSPFFQGLICGERPTPPHLTPAGLPQEIELHMPGIQASSSSLPASLPPTTPSLATTPTDSVSAQSTTDGLQTVLDLLDYIYTGRIELREDSVHLLVQLAEALALDGLSALVRDYVNGTGETEAKPAVQKKGRFRQPATSPTQRQRKRKAPPRKLPVVGRTASSARTAIKSETADEAMMTTTATTTTTLAGNQPSNTAVNEADGDKEISIEAQSVAEPTPRTLRSRKRTARALPAATYTDDDDDDDNPSADDNFVLRGGSNNTSNNGKRVNRAKKHTFKCGQCEFVSSEATAVREHKQIHHRSKSFVCLTCGFFSGYCTKMLAHLLSANHAETKCSLCAFEATDREAFTEHLKKHEDLKPFFCQLCDKRYRSQCLLARHLARHSAERPFVCDVCGRGFKNKHFMLIHVSNHSAVKSFSCPQCDYKTSFKTNLNMHVRGHKEGKIPCPREGCKFQSISKYNLQSHLLTHQKQKPFQCEVCGQKFAQERSRRRHAKIHNPESMLRCGQCQFSTVSRYRLSEHVYKVHENGPPIPSKRVRKPRGDSTRAHPPLLPPSSVNQHQQHNQQGSSLPVAAGNHNNNEQQQQQHHHHERKMVQDMGVGQPLPGVSEHVRMVYQDCQPVIGSLEMYTPRMWFP